MCPASSPARSRLTNATESVTDGAAARNPPRLTFVAPVRALCSRVGRLPAGPLAGGLGPGRCVRQLASLPCCHNPGTVGPGLTGRRVPAVSPGLLAAGVRRV